MAKGHGQWDVAVGATERSGIEARARAAYGLTNSIALEAEGFASDVPGFGVDYGALAGVTGHF